MAKPGTTHVIEIETGIGEPAFIPLTMGSELQPISVGKKGMWRIESARVLDVHAFVYFDGTSLFVQSADESNAASVDGYRVGKAWTELHAPCKIEIGAARLRFRSLTEPAAPEPPAAAPSVPPRPGPAASGERPFAPGEFSSGQPPGESTRVGDSRPVAVVDAGAVQRSARPTGMPVHSSGAPVQAIPQSQHPPGLMNNAIMSGMHSIAQQGPGHQPQMTGPVMPMNMPPMQMPMNGGAGSGSVGVMSGSGAYGAMGQNNSGAYSRGAPTIQTSQQEGLGGLIAKYKELNPQKRLLVLMAPFCLAASAYLLLFDDDDPGPQEQAIVSVDAGSTVAIPPAGPQPPTNCPAGFVPYSIPVNGQIPCVPRGTPMPPVQPSVALQQPMPLPAPQPQPQPLPPQPGGKPPLPVTQPAPQPPGPDQQPMAGTKTLERQAVDAVAVNDYARAAAIYETLLQQSNPKNPVYAEAARILRQKADAGAP